MGEVLEPGRIQLDETHVEGIADATGPDDLVRQERAPQPRDVALQARPGRVGRPALPERLLQPVRAHLAPTGGDEHSQELAALQPLDRHERAPAPYLDRTEHVEGDARHHVTIVVVRSQAARDQALWRGGR